MYRYSVDNTVTYTPDDFVLFRESPFAAWMERLTLENPDHGIPPDINGSEPPDTAERQDDIVETLRAEGRDVALIDWEQSESLRRVATLDAMRSGVDFVVNAQLALGPLSGTVNLLMRTSGYSDLGDHLYIPCDTQVKTTLHSAFRLCFLADLLHGLQGQLPPQMLIIRGGSDVVPLQTDEHIYYYRAVKQRFMQAMAEFRKHRMPDPAESSHFGRWSECASEVLKQRAERAEQGLDEAGDEASEELQAPQLQVVSAGGGAAQSAYMGEEALQVEPFSGSRVQALGQGAVSLESGATGPTLAEQAQLLAPDSFRVKSAPGHTPNLARFGRPRLVDSAEENKKGDGSEASGDNKAMPRRRNADVALQNLEFIGSGASPSFEVEPPVLSTASVQESSVSVPVEPLASAPEEPSASVKVEPLAPAPEEPLVRVQEEPLVPVQEEPLVPVQEEPLLPVQEEPLVPVQEEPLVPVQEEPLPAAKEQLSAFMQKSSLADMALSPLEGECLEPESPWPDTEPQLQSAPEFRPAPPAPEVQEAPSAPAPEFREAPSAPERHPAPAAPEFHQTLAAEKSPLDELPAAEGLLATKTALLPELEPREPFLLPPEELMAEAAQTMESVSPEPRSHPLDSSGLGGEDLDVVDLSVAEPAVIDMDSAPPPTLAPVVERAEAAARRRGQLLDLVEEGGDQAKVMIEEKISPAPPGFSDSLMTSDDFDDS